MVGNAIDAMVRSDDRTYWTSEKPKGDHRGKTSWTKLANLSNGAIFLDAVTRDVPSAKTFRTDGASLLSRPAPAALCLANARRRAGTGLGKLAPAISEAFCIFCNCKDIDEALRLLQGQRDVIFRQENHIAIHVSDRIESFCSG